MEMLSKRVVQSSHSMISSLIEPYENFSINAVFLAGRIPNQ
jgi:hypothetical protein